MAELHLTEEEIESKSYLGWDDESLGKLLKATAMKIEDYHGKDTSVRMAAALILLSFLEDSGETRAILDLSEVERDGETLGDFKVVVAKKDETSDILDNL
jgi:hypothetical protein